MAIFNQSLTTNNESNNQKKGESYKEILKLWWPELVSTTLILILPIILDALIVSKLSSTNTYSALGVATTFLNMLTKLAESFGVATIVLVGSLNGAQKYKDVGKALSDAFWATFISGFIPFILLFSFATEVYIWLGTPEQIAIIGAPFLRLRAFGVFLAFLIQALFGFMRSVKNTKTPMQILVIGIVTFIMCDYALVLGKFGFSQIGLNGSAYATIIQYSLMLALSFWHIFTNEDYKKYFQKMFFFSCSKEGFLRTLNLVWPIAIDKTALASAYIFLNKAINSMGTNAIAAFTTVWNMERIAFLPAISLAVVITFLVSNHIGNHNTIAARSIIKKTLYLGGGMVLVSLIIMSLNAHSFAHLFDPENKFTDFAAFTFPFVSIFVLFDFIQLILCGTLRGSGDVKGVMVIRVIASYIFFYPLVTFISWLNIPNPALKFILIYGSFYVHSGFIGLLCLIRLKGKNFKSDKI